MVKYLRYISLAALCLFLVSCGSQNIRHNARLLPKGAAIAIILNASEEYAEKTHTLFVLSGFSVKAISVFKEEQAYLSEHLDGLFRLDIYNSEIAKAANLRTVRDNLNADYLVILEFKKTKMNWGRVIDLHTNEIIFIANYTSSTGGDVEPVINYFILSMMSE